MVNTSSKSQSIDVLEMLIIIFFLLSNKFFYLVKLPFFYMLGDQSLTALFAILLFVFTVLNAKVINIDKFGQWIFLFFLFLIIELIYSYVHYSGESLVGMLKQNIYFCVFFGYLVVNYWITTVEKFKDFIMIITWICLITNILIIVNSLIYNVSGHFILQLGGTNYGTITKVLFRENGIRIRNTIAGLSTISGIISFGYITSSSYNTGSRLIHLVNYLSAFIAIYYVEQSRVALLVMFLASFVVLLFSNDVSKKTKLFLIICGALLILTVGFGVINGAITSIMQSLNDSQDGTSVYRMQEISYYWHSATLSPLFGLGLVSSTGINAAIVSGVAGKWTYTDVGIVGIIGKFGFTGGLFYLSMLGMLFRLSYSRKQKDRGIKLGIWITLVFGLVTFSYLDSQRIMGLLLAMIFCKKSVEFNMN